MKVQSSSSELAIMHFLASRTHASAAEIGAACTMAIAEVRARLVMLESMRLISGQRDPNASPGKLQRVYHVTAEGRRKAGVGDGRTAPKS
ncbi:MAG: hypothetical protein ACRYGP_30595 [Janthinobacterium lividum]